MTNTPKPPPPPDDEAQPQNGVVDIWQMIDWVFHAGAPPGEADDESDTTPRQADSDEPKKN